VKNKAVFTVALILLAAIIMPVVLSGCDYVTGEAITAPTPTPTAENAIKNVTPEEAHELFILSSRYPAFTYIDVRTPEEYSDGHIDNAINIDFNSADFKETINKLDKNAAYLVYCRSGVRSAAASAIMAELGFTDLYNMTGGFLAWQAAGYPAGR
jgi:rhodanese-related sulfurtransferase